MKILILHTSTRPENLSQHVAKFVRQEFEEKSGAEILFAAAQDFQLDLSTEGWNAAPAEIMELFDQADAVVFVSPEYNHGYPASLKFLLDSTTGQLTHKPAAFVGVSSGGFGGARMIEQLVGVIRKLKMIPAYRDFHASDIESAVDSQGEPTDRATWERRLQPLMENLLWLARMLKEERQNQSK